MILGTTFLCWRASRVRSGTARLSSTGPLPSSLECVRAKLSGSDDGDRQMVKVLTAVLTDGLQAVEAACAEALAAGIASADVILNSLARRQQATPPAPVAIPERLKLTMPPLADCARYDALRSPPSTVLSPVAMAETRP